MVKTSKVLSFTLKPKMSSKDAVENQYFLEHQDLLQNKLVGADGTVIPISDELFRLLKEITPVLEEGRLTVTIAPETLELTTQQSADILNVSRPFLIKLLEKGDIPYLMVGTHRRIKQDDLERYKEKRNMARRQALNELTELMEEEGLFD